MDTVLLLLLLPLVLVVMLRGKSAQRTNLVSVLQEANDDLETTLLDSSVEVSFTVS